MSEKDSMETVEELVLNNDDMEAINNFSKFFEAEPTSELKEAIERFRKDNSLTNQKLVKLALANWIIESKSDIFQDEVWNSPKETMDKVRYELTFEKDLVDLLTKPEAKK